MASDRISTVTHGEVKFALFHSMKACKGSRIIATTHTLNLGTRWTEKLRKIGKIRQLKIKRENMHTYRCGNTSRQECHAKGSIEL